MWCAVDIFVLYSALAFLAHIFSGCRAANCTVWAGPAALVLQENLNLFKYLNAGFSKAAGWCKRSTAFLFNSTALQSSCLHSPLFPQHAAGCSCPVAGFSHLAVPRSWTQCPCPQPSTPSHTHCKAEFLKPTSYLAGFISIIYTSTW